MQSETKFKLRVMRDLLSLPGIWFVKTQMVAVRGIPDLLVCLAGRFVAIELKRDAHAHIDKLQTYTLNQIAEAGGQSFVAHPENWAHILELLRGMVELSNPPP